MLHKISQLFLNVLGKKFEYYDPVTPEDETFKFCDITKKQKSSGSTSSPVSYTSSGGSCSSSKSKQTKKFDYPKAPGDTSFNENMNNSHAGNGNTAATNSPTAHNTHHDKRHSVVTESTVSGDSELSAATTIAICESSTSSGNGGVGGCGSGGNGGGSGCGGSGCGSSGIPNSGTNIGESNDGNTANGGGCRSRSRRRHAINITSNPGYQVGN